MSNKKETMTLDVDLLTRRNLKEDLVRVQEINTFLKKDNELLQKENGELCKELEQAENDLNELEDGLIRVNEFWREYRLRKLLRSPTFANTPVAIWAQKQNSKLTCSDQKAVDDWQRSPQPKKNTDDEERKARKTARYIFDPEDETTPQPTHNNTGE